MAYLHPTVARPHTAGGAARWAAPLASGTITAAFAYLAFRLSFESLTALAVEHGTPPDIVWMFAALVDGGAVVGTAGVMMAQYTGRAVWPYWLVVAVFACTSLGFNVAHSDRSAAGVAIAVTPPLAQLVAVELLVRLLPAPPATTGAAAPDTLAATGAAAPVATRHEPATPAPPRPPVVPPGARLLPVVAPPLDDGGEQLVVDVAALAAAVAPRPPQAAVEAPLVAFVAPPLDDELLDEDQEHEDVDEPAAAPIRRPSDEQLDAYERLLEQHGRRPTAPELGELLGVKRSRGQTVRAAVEAWRASRV
ncbi:DUF2637 domain-containing protein [Embleya sp. MST-111070]|uniref:DUF2637 domain-containing protein n=1 Tax=Embleya sp. MST-111070 TaxID=3398231 RepID=UPI003F735853